MGPHCQDVNIGWPVRWCNPIWKLRTRLTVAADFWYVTRRTPVALLGCERETPHLLKGKYRNNRKSGAVCVYKWQKSFAAPIPFDKNVTGKTFIQLSNHNTIYKGDASSSIPKWRIRRIIVPVICLGRTLRKMNAQAETTVSELQQ